VVCIVFDQIEFNRFILDNKVVGIFTEPITLKSGRQSYFYANWRSVVCDVWLSERLVGFVLDFCRDNIINVDTFYGVPEGATKLGILTQFHMAKATRDYKKGSHVLAMGRARPKEHGDPKDRFFVGAPKGNIAVIEDVTTTGDSLVKALEGLKESGFTVTAVISLTDRMVKRDDKKSVQQAIEGMGIPFHRMSDITDILPEICKNADKEVVEKIIEEFDQYGVKPLRLSR